MGKALSWGVLVMLGMRGGAQEVKPVALRVDWERVVATSRSTPTLQVVVNPQLLRGAKLHDPSFAALKELGAEYVRYVPWLPYPKQAVAELEAPSGGKTSWDFSHIDPTLDDFMKATAGHSVVLNFSTIPAWMFKTAKPVTYPEDPNQVFWGYTQGTELRDPTMAEAAGYFARLISWYTQGGLRDEAGVWRESGHHYKVAYWEVLNEIDYEHNWTPEAYSRFYDAVTAAMRKVDPELKFMALGLGGPEKQAPMFEYFLNPANHAAGAKVDYISYHFYAHPKAEETIANWQYSFFDQEEGFLSVVRFVEEMRKRGMPGTKTALNELGVILPEDERENREPGYVARAEPAGYWNLAGALFADLYLQVARMGIEVVGESQLVGYRSQFGSVSMMDFETGRPNARFWVLKVLKENFGPGDRLVGTAGGDAGVAVQAFETARGRRILLVNKRLEARTVTLPAGWKGGEIEVVTPSTGEGAPAWQAVGETVRLEGNEVAVIRR